MELGLNITHGVELKKESSEHKAACSSKCSDPVSKASPKVLFWLIWGKEQINRMRILVVYRYWENAITPPKWSKGDTVPKYSLSTALLNIANYN